MRGRGCVGGGHEGSELLVYMTSYGEAHVHFALKCLQFLEGVCDS